MEVNRYSGVSGIRGKLVKCLSRNDVGSEMLFCGNQHVLGNMRTAFATFLMVSCTIRPSPHVDIPLPDGHRTICGEAKYQWCREEYSSKNRLKHGRLGSRAGYDRSGLRLWRKTFSPLQRIYIPPQRKNRIRDGLRNKVQPSKMRSYSRPWNSVSSFPLNCPRYAAQIPS